MSSSNGRPRLAVDARRLRRPATGIHEYLVRAVGALLDDGFEVTLLANCRLDKWAPAVAGARQATFGSTSDPLWEQRDLAHFLRLHDFDVYWAPGNTGIPLRSVRPTVTVVTIHDLVPLRLPRMYLMRDAAYSLSYLSRIAVSIFRSDHVLTVSDSSARDIRHLSGRRSTVIPSYLGTHRRVVDEKLLPGGLVGTEYVVYTGGLDPRKNVQLLLRAFSVVRRSHDRLLLVLVGPGFELFEPLIDELGLSGAVVRTGYVDDATRDTLVGCSRLLVYPSLYEGFGLPIIEAFELGVPVVASRTSALEEVGGSAVRYVDPRDADSVASGIIDALQPKERLRQRSAAAVRLADYDPAEAARKICEYFRSVAAGGRGHSFWAGQPRGLLVRNGDER